MALGRPRTCDCGKCPRCQQRARQARWWAGLSSERKAEIVAGRRKSTTTRDRADWRKRNPGKSAAHSKVRRAILAGRLVRQPCEICGRLDSQGHHDDYLKPLEVRWLCPAHHAEAHMEVAA